MHARTRTHAHARTHTYARTHACTHTHTHTHAHTHTHTHTHTNQCLLLAAAAQGRNRSKSCFKTASLTLLNRYYRDGANTRPTPPYVPGRQPPYVFSGANEGPPLFSGLWTHVYGAALHSTGSDSAMWVTTRAVGGKSCQAAGPSHPSTCNPGLWYGMVSLIEGSVIFNPRLYNEDVVVNSQMSVMFPALAVNSNGSLLIQFAYASGDSSEEGVLDNNGDHISTYTGACARG